MKIAAMFVMSVAVGAGVIGAATSFRSSSSSLTNWPSGFARDRAGPDSTRVASLFASLQATDPVICGLIADQVGNFWGSDHRLIGRFSGEPVNLQAAKDSVSGHVTDARAIELLIKTLSTPNVCVRRLASKMLGNSSFDSQRLVALLKSSDANVRESAAYAAGHRDSLDIRAALESALDDRVPAVAAMAAWALGAGEDGRAIPALIRAARHADVRVRATAIWALSNLNDNDQGSQASILPVLEAALSDRDIEVQRVAADAYSSIDELHVAPPALVKALSSRDAELRHYAAAALAEIADPNTTTQLVALVTDPDREIRKSVVEALGKIGTSEALKGLTRALSDKDPEVRKAAVEALGESKER